MGDIIAFLKALANILDGVNKIWGLFTKKGSKPAKSTKEE